MPLELLQELSGHTERVWTLAWNPNGTILATSGCDKTIRLWAQENDKWFCVSILTETHNKSIRRLCWSPCGQYLASASFDATVCIWKRDYVTGFWSTVVNLEGHESEVKSVAWSHDGKYLATCGRDRTVWIWERASNELSDDEDSVENWDCSDVKNDHSKDVKHILWHPNQNILVSCSYDDSIKLFNKKGDDWECFETLSSHTSTIWSADFSASGEFLVTCSDDKTIRIWQNTSHAKLPLVENNSWKCLSVVQGYHNRTIYDVSWSKLDEVIASASGDNSIAVYARSQDTTTQRDLFICVDKLSQSHVCDVNTLAWNPKVPRLLASGGDDHAIKLWNYTTEEKGMQPLDTIVESIMKSLDIQNKDDEILSESTKTITDFQSFSNLLKSVQDLQNELQYDEEKHQLEDLFDVRIIKENPKPVDVTDLRFDEKDNSINSFTIPISDHRGEIKFNILVNFDKTKFSLAIPRRSSNILLIAKEIFLYERTGDLYRILESGKSQFLLGHLFTFSDVRFVTDHKGCQIKYIISGDRDEKIRITNYPNAHKIERFCFGHRHFVRKILTIDDTKFLSIDQENTANMWNLSDLSKDNSQPLSPEKTLTLGQKSVKRFCLRESAFDVTPLEQNNTKK